MLRLPMLLENCAGLVVGSTQRNSGFRADLLLKTRAKTESVTKLVFANLYYLRSEGLGM